ncbi:MAG: pyridoxal phosphate-dependent aminotransferase [Thermodesulfobacteriota bacterium]|nr:pyridoxal phosphate-dependent aminotransferase [Thermodesulfobacteriota bacterium]
MIAGRAKDIPPFIVMDILEKAQEMERAGVDIVHLEIGEPDFDTPECIKAAGRKAITDGRTHYTHSLGIIELREAVAAHYHRRYGAEVSPDNILICSGTSPAMFMIFTALLEAGDEVILSDPHYACYPNFVRFLNGRPVFVNVDEDDGFQYRPEEIKARLTNRTRAVFINSPANPTGTLLSPDRMSRIADISPLVISDEIYHGLVYGGEREHSILEFTDRAVVINGFSKLYAMTGWRLGYIIAPAEFIRPMQKIQQNFFISAGSVPQWAGVAALNQAGPDVKRMVAVYDKRRIFLIQGLRDLGFKILTEPKGAFYILVNAAHLSRDSYRLAFDILDKAHVGVTPGIDFGTNAEGYLRFSYATSVENIAEGLGRLKGYLDGRQDRS